MKCHRADDQKRDGSEGCPTYAIYPVLNLTQGRPNRRANLAQAQWCRAFFEYRLHGYSRLRYYDCFICCGVDMNFWFCETCGKRLTEKDIAEGAARNKKLNGVYCQQCSVGVMTMEMDAISIEQLGISKASPPSPA